MIRHFYITFSFVGEDAEAARDENTLKKNLDWFQKDVVFLNRHLFWTQRSERSMLALGTKEDLQFAPERCELFETDETDLKSAIAAFSKTVIQREEVQVVFLVIRPSQMFRPLGLIQRIVDTFCHINKPTVSASRISDIGWREVSNDGSWKATNEKGALFADDRLMIFYDSQIEEAFDRTTEHTVVEVDCANTTSPDFYTDYQIHHTVRCEKEGCILIGSGLDLAGRNLGAQIDAGVFGKVFRVNKLYGSQQDVGIRTDGFFSFGLGYWDQRTLEWYGKILPCGESVYTPTNDIGCALQRKIMEEYPPFAIKPSTGFYALYELLKRGYLPTVIGFGFKNGRRTDEKKIYCDGTFDYGMGGHDFAHENELLWQFNEEGRIILL